MRTRIHIDDPNISSLETLDLAEKLAKQHDLDLSDALQLITVKHGKFCKLAGESKTVLITSDRSLEKAAVAEGLRVWNPEKESEPPDCRLEQQSQPGVAIFKFNDGIRDYDGPIRRGCRESLARRQY